MKIKRKTSKLKNVSNLKKKSRGRKILRNKTNKNKSKKKTKVVS